MFSALGKWVEQFRWLILGLGLILLIGGGVYGSGVFGVLKSGGVGNANEESSQAAVELQKAFPNQQASLVILLQSSEHTVQEPVYQTAVQQIVTDLQARPAVTKVTDFYQTQAPQLVSKDGHSTSLIVTLKGNDAAQSDEYLTLRDTLKNDTLQVKIGGTVAVTQEINAQIKHDIAQAERLSFILLAVLLLFIFRSIIGMLLPLLVGVLSIITALALTRLVATHADMSVYAANIITFLGLGLAIDYSLFMLSRFREELANPRARKDIIIATLQSAGRTVAFSGSIVALSMLGLLVFPLTFLKSMAVGGALAVVSSVVVSLTVLPAALAVLEHRVNWGTIPLPQPKKGTEGFWTRLSHFVMKRAGSVMVVTLGILFLAGSPFLRVKFTTLDAHSLPANFESREVSDILARDFPDGDASPMSVVVEMPGSPLEGANRQSLADYTFAVGHVAGVTRIDGLATIDPSLPIPASEALAASKVSGNDTVISVFFAGDPQSTEAQRILKDVRAVPKPAGATVLVGGQTANLVDLLTDLQDHLWQAALVIGLSTFILLLFMLSSILIPLKAILLNALSLSAAFGGLVWIFQYGHLEKLFAFTSNGSLDANQPILVFVIAFGLAMDYEVFLVSRIKERFEHSHDTVDAVTFGLEKTGQIITSAALLLIVVIGAFATSKIGLLKQLGIGLALAVAIDAVIVRSLLVPATMRFFGEYNWWTPPFLRKIIARANLASSPLFLD
jgi:uncharacterized membrane protein YdfJ with MMPL/SSD domain